MTSQSSTCRLRSGQMEWFAGTGSLADPSRWKVTADLVKPSRWPARRRRAQTQPCIIARSRSKDARRDSNLEAAEAIAGAPFRATLTVRVDVRSCAMFFHLVFSFVLVRIRQDLMCPRFEEERITDKIGVDLISFPKAGDFLKLGFLFGLGIYWRWRRFPISRWDLSVPWTFFGWLYLIHET